MSCSRSAFAGRARRLSVGDAVRRAGTAVEGPRVDGAAVDGRGGGGRRGCRSGRGGPGRGRPRTVEVRRRGPGVRRGVSVRASLVRGRRRGAPLLAVERINS